ncbi:MAG: hypothetical protein A3E85_03240 [Gammaproteobacteria bacterium RIFCSPHIGHO2_12_FULL_45_12]|nr:MAG: hypothetical protein A3E85_03240 [Gammaproteobacteria bacterium RIFCSPHIGHO2_12_FULL_45_12]
MERSSKNKIQHSLGELGAIYKKKDLASKLNVSPKTIACLQAGETEPPSYIMPEPQHTFNTRDVSAHDKEFTCIDLFAGIGGIRLGFENQGGECVFTSERDPYCQKTYRENFGNNHPLIGDIVKYDPQKIPDHDVLLAGFPCQPFSIAGVSKKISLGRPHGFKDKTQGTFFFNVAQILGTKKPAAFMLENVKNLKSHDKGNTLKVILEVLVKELGYHVQWRMIDAQHFVPQHRERIIIVGFREKTDFNFNDLVLPAPKKRMKDILHSEDGSELDLDQGRFINAKGKVHDKYVLSEK